MGETTKNKTSYRLVRIDGGDNVSWWKASKLEDFPPAECKPQFTRPKDWLSRSKSVAATPPDDQSRFADVSIVQVAGCSYESGSPHEVSEENLKTALEILETSSKLSQVHLSGEYISREHISALFEALGKNTTSKAIDLYFDDHFQYHRDIILKTWPNIRKLRIIKADPGEDHLIDMLNSPKFWSLQELHLVKCNLYSRVVETLMDAVAEHTCLEAFVLDSWLLAEELQIVATGLLALKSSLRQLCLRVIPNEEEYYGRHDERPDREASQALMAALVRHGPTMEDLDIQYGNLADESFSLLCQRVLPRMSRLGKLRLSKGFPEPDMGYQPIAWHLKNITDEIAFQLAQYLEQHAKAMTHLSLEFEIGVAGGVALLRALRSLPSLQHLDYRCGNMDVRHALWLGEAIRASTNMTFLRLHAWDFPMCYMKDDDKAFLDMLRPMILALANTSHVKSVEFATWYSLKMEEGEIFEDAMGMALQHNLSITSLFIDDCPALFEYMDRNKMLKRMSSLSEKLFTCSPEVQAKILLCLLREAK